MSIETFQIDSSNRDAFAVSGIGGGWYDERALSSTLSVSDGQATHTSVLAYLQFKVNIPASCHITKAKLRLWSYGNYTGNETFKVYRAAHYTDPLWPEPAPWPLTGGSLTWNPSNWVMHHEYNTLVTEYVQYYVNRVGYDPATNYCCLAVGRGAYAVGNTVREIHSSTSTAAYRPKLEVTYGLSKRAHGRGGITVQGYPTAHGQPWGVGP